MNVVDMIKSQLAGEVGKKLGGMLGANESDMGKILSAGLPSVLSGLGTIASSKSGADKLADAVGKMDSSSFGDLGKMLGSNAMSSGGGMLSSLMGGSLVDGIAAAISKYTGINVSMVKMALGYLTPMVLGSVGSTFKGGKVDGAGISKLFSEQKSNIASSMPSGFSLDSVPGFQALAGNVANKAQQATKQVAEEAQSGLGKLLIPAAILGALVLAAVFFLNRKPADVINDVKNQASAATNSAAGMVDKAKDAVSNTASDAVDAAKKALGGADSMKTGMTDMMDGLFSKLEGVKDAAGAEEILPTLKDSLGKLEGMATGVSALPAEGKSMISTLIKSQLDKLNPLIEKISAIPGIGDAIKQVLIQLKDKLASMVG
ncbi:MAG: DUF937 domain-containing protein [Pirellula sp.]